MNHSFFRGRLNQIARISLLCFSLVFFQWGHAQYHIPKKVKRIVFLGNSITYNGQYIEFLDYYFAVQRPDTPFEIINIGLPSETVSGLSEPKHARGRFPRPDLRERLDRALKATKPDLVIACYGMNDGIYMPFDDKRFKAYQDGIQWLYNSVADVGSDILMVTPPIYDGDKGEAYSNVLDIYSHWLISKRHTHDWHVIDLHGAMKRQLEKERLAQADFTYAQDGIHPNQQGHYEMAKPILRYLGAASVAETLSDFLGNHPKGKEIFGLIGKRQRLTKDAWLTHIGHQRPNMAKGKPLKEALQQVKEINRDIQQLLDGEYMEKSN